MENTEWDLTSFSIFCALRPKIFVYETDCCTKQKQVGMNEESSRKWKLNLAAYNS